MNNGTGRYLVGGRLVDADGNPIVEEAPAKPKLKELKALVAGIDNVEDLQSLLDQEDRQKGRELIQARLAELSGE